MIPTHKISTFISNKRFDRYKTRCNNDVALAFEYYKSNIIISESTYFALSVCEVSLRNQIHNKFSQFYNTSDWYIIWLNDNSYSDFHGDINSAIGKIQQRGEIVNSDKIVAELTFGFWTKLFNNKYQLLFWKTLSKIFVNMNKADRKLSNVKPIINKARIFRNRIYHYEPVCWSYIAVLNNYDNIITLLNYLDTDIKVWVEKYSTFRASFNNQKNYLTGLGINTK